ncbi:hypothetical protein KPH14_001020 [Odynerus spinipes]|uniref:FP protein C-terminal domain-containing protein n=1 Tax=Odynerus spinipes TaxID=1348599 RepID=A0AAD9REG5_9HYME|nr:hypothetical protein KPH14_001020 [Odynerus spinipes]
MAARLDVIAGDLTAFSARQRDVETGTTALRGDLTSLAERQEAVAASLTARVSSLEATSGGGSPALDAVKETVTSNTRELARVNACLSRYQAAEHSADLIVSGIPEVAQENLPATIGSLAAILGVPASAADFKECRRMRGVADPNRPRAIFVRLSGPPLRDALVAARKKKPQLLAREIAASFGERLVHVHEFLPRGTWSLLRQARVVAREQGYQYVWVRVGRVYARKANGTALISISSPEDLTKIC